MPGQRRVADYAHQSHSGQGEDADVDLDQGQSHHRPAQQRRRPSRGTVPNETCTRQERREHHDDQVTGMHRLVDEAEQRLDGTELGHKARDGAAGERLGVMSREVGQSGDRWLASDGGVGSMVIVEVQPAR